MVVRTAAQSLRAFMQEESAGGIVLMVAAVLALALFGDEPDAGEIQEAVDQIFILILLGYSREDELQADRLGTIYAHRAGYDPNAMITLLEKLQQQERGKYINFLSSHPPTGDRIEEARIVIAALER